MENYLQLVRQAKNGDTKAFAGLYETVYQDMYRFAVYMLKNPEDAKDVVSDTVLDAFATIGKLRNEESFRSWIFRILTNKCKKMLGTYMEKGQELTEEVLEGAALPKLEEAEGVVIREMFFALPQEERIIIAMHLFGGYTSRELAQLLEMNENTIRSKESRALKKLAGQMGI